MRSLPVFPGFVLMMALAIPASAEVSSGEKPDADALRIKEKVRSVLVLCMKVGDGSEGRKVCARALRSAKSLAEKKRLDPELKGANLVEGFMTALGKASDKEAPAALEARFDAIAGALPVGEFKPKYAKHFRPPAPPGAPDQAGASGESRSQPRLDPKELKALKDHMDSMSRALLPTKTPEGLPSSPGAGAAPWQADARDIHRVWTARHPRTADPSLSEFAARELQKHGIPWKVALANWDYATDLKPTHRTQAGSMVAEGMTDASWSFCKGHPEAVREFLGREPKRSDLYNPRASILWWIAEYEVFKRQLGADADPWQVARAVFLPAAVNGSRKTQARADREVRNWKRIAERYDKEIIGE